MCAFHREEEAYFHSKSSGSSRAGDAFREGKELRPSQESESMARGRKLSWTEEVEANLELGGKSSIWINLISQRHSEEVCREREVPPPAQKKHDEGQQQNQCTMDKDKGKDIQSHDPAVTSVGDGSQQKVDKEDILLERTNLSAPTRDTSVVKNEWITSLNASK
ncbi:hypothetical protein HAX54_009259 [Datura stramonium]|uniref:Uncharacterized protein n=1 Tax=Datura stramonium TaxID=4076 RepID=A0ABS8RVZ1_DATST|nr:hypothetical protein [Datura stramonium]